MGSLGLTSTSNMTTTFSPPPKGVYVPVPTFFQSFPSSSSTQTQSQTQAPLDMATQTAHAVHLARAGIRGLVLLGSTGEAMHLSRTERKSLVSTVREGLTAAGCGSEYPIVAGVLTNSVDDAVQGLEDMAEAGAQWGLVLVPGYFGGMVNQENAREWFETVADRSPIGVLIYHYPGVTNNVQLTPETYTALAAHPKIVGCKMSHGNVSHHLQVSLDPAINHEKFHLYSGFGQQLFPVVISGGAGVIDALAAVYPHTVVNLYKLATSLPIDAKLLKRVNDLQWAVSKAEEMVAASGIVGIKEAIFRVLGMGNLDGGRLPLKGSMGKGEWEKWREVTGAMGKLEAQFAG